jgi:Domain of unknown function (DUF4203)
MLPPVYGPPAAIVLILGGALACFAGYRLFRIVLGIYGFILGAMLTSSVMGVGNTIGMLVAAAIGGIVGSIVLVMAYFVGIALVGAGLGALIGHVIWTWVRPGDPPALAVVVVALVGAVGAMWLQRYVIIVGTAFGGAWTIIVGAVNLLATRGITRGASATEVWILYPTSTPGERWAPIAWIVLGLLGVTVQLGLTGKKRK